MMFMSSLQIPSLKSLYVIGSSLMKTGKKKKPVEFFCMAASLDIFVSDPP